MSTKKGYDYIHAQRKEVVGNRNNDGYEFVIVSKNRADKVVKLKPSEGHIFMFHNKEELQDFIEELKSYEKCFDISKVGDDEAENSDDEARNELFNTINSITEE